MGVPGERATHRSCRGRIDRSGRGTTWPRPGRASAAAGGGRRRALDDGTLAARYARHRSGRTVRSSDPGRPFTGEPRSEQTAAAEAMAPHDTGALAATTAFGKTVIAAWLIAQRHADAEHDDLQRQRACAHPCRHRVLRGCLQRRQHRDPGCLPATQQCGDLAQVIGPGAGLQLAADHDRQQGGQRAVNAVGSLQPLRDWALDLRAATVVRVPRWRRASTRAGAAGPERPSRLRLGWL